MKKQEKLHPNLTVTVKELIARLEAKPPKETKDKIKHKTLKDKDKTP